MGRKKLTLVAWAVSVAMDGGVDAVTQLFHHHPQRGGIGLTQAGQPMGIDKYGSPPQGAFCRETSHGQAHHITVGQQDIHIKLVAEPQLAHSLNLGQQDLIRHHRVQRTWEQGQELLGTEPAQVLLHQILGLLKQVL